MSVEGEELVRAIAERFSGVRPLLEEHLNDYEEVLPHVFFGDFARYVISLFAAAYSKEEKGSRDELTGILDFSRTSLRCKSG